MIYNEQWRYFAKLQAPITYFTPHFYIRTVKTATGLNLYTNCTFSYKQKVRATHVVKKKVHGNTAIVQINISSNFICSRYTRH